MSICQTSPRLEKRPGAFCFLRSEKRPANRTDRLPEGHRPKKRKLFVRYPCTLFFLPVSSMYVDAFLGILVRLAGVLGSWIWQLLMLIGATPLLSFPWRSFAVVDVEASRITCCRGSCVFFQAVAAPLQPGVAAQATLVDLSIPGLISFTRKRHEKIAEGVIEA